MKNERDQAAILSAYIDGAELTPDEAARAEHLLATSREARRELELVGAVRSTLRARATTLRTPVPVDLERSIRLAIGNEVQAASQSRPSLGSRILAFLARPAIAIPAAVVIAVCSAVIYLTLPRTQPEFELASASYANFGAIVRGDLKLAKASGDTAELQRFFRENGVKYSVFFPQIDAELKGGVVSTHGDLKFAHLVYGTGEHLVYLFEVDEPSIEEGSVELQSRIAADVDRSRWHWEERAGVGTLFVWKSNSIMCSAVSDLGTQDFSALFRLETL